MKRKINSILSILVIMLVIITTEHASAQCSYTYTAQTSGTTGFLFSVKAVDQNVGWAAGSPTSAGTTPIIRRTVNGGLNWTDGNPNPGVINGAVYNIEATDSLTAWCTTSPSSSFIYKTTNGGQTWVSVYQQVGGFIDVIKMQTPLSGYAIGDPVGSVWTILTTVNGGTNWTQLATAPPQVGGETGLNNSAQVMLPNIWYGTSTGKVYHSSNLGVTWTGVNTVGNTAGVDAIRYNTTTNGLIGGAALNKSTDGGSSYNTATALGTGNITGINGNTDSTYFYCRGTSIFYSTNNGNSFTSAYTAPTSTYNHLDLVAVGTCLKGWAVTGNGGITKIDGNPTGIQPISTETPASFSLSQNYPNPFNPTTNFNFSLPKASFVAIKIYDVVGKEVAILSNETRQAGTYRVEFDASSLPSGVYFYSIQTSSFTDTKKMVLVK